MATRRGSKSSRRRLSKRASKKRRSRGRGRVAVRAAWRDDLNEQLQGHRSDALFLLLGVLGVIAALGIYSDLAGPFGRAVDAARRPCSAAAGSSSRSRCSSAHSR